MWEGFDQAEACRLSVPVFVEGGLDTSKHLQKFLPCILLHGVVLQSYIFCPMMPEKMVKLVMNSATFQVDAQVFSMEEVTASCQVDLPEVGRLPMWGRVVGWSRPMAKLPIDFNLLEDLGKLAEMFQLFSKKDPV